MVTPLFRLLGLLDRLLPSHDYDHPVGAERLAEEEVAEPGSNYCPDSSLLNWGAHLTETDVRRIAREEISAAELQQWGRNFFDPK
jgi:hypothetical protein